MDAPGLDPDRLLPAHPRTPELARELYDVVADAPILSPHGHVDPAVLLDDRPFPDPATLLVSSDHYVTRLLHAGGATMAELGFGPEPAEPREVWRRFCAGWPLFAGTASGGWLRDILSRVFAVGDEPSAENADELFDRMSARLAEPGLRPRALFAAARIEVLATTDDPLDPLDVHAELRDRALVPGRVIPTFRPDAYLDPSRADWNERVDRLSAGYGTGFGGYLDALRGRREHFLRHGAVSADHGVVHPAALELPRDEASALFDRLRRGQADPGDDARFSAVMLFESARMSVDDGLAMTVHAGVLRNHHAPTFERFGPDTGHDIPVPVSFTEGLRPLLGAFGTAPGFHLILFTADASTASRELAPLAGFYPSVFVGAPWWFLDAPDAMLRYRETVTETAGFHRGSGFIDDTRAFLSIPARHDVARRVDAGYLARLVIEGRIMRAVADSIARDLVDAIPRTAFKL